VQRLSEATGYQCEIVGLKWLSDCLAAGKLRNRSDFMLCEPRPTSQASASPQPEKQPFTNVVDDKEAAAAEKAKRKREWVTLAANQSFTLDWEESPPPVAVSQSSAVVKSEAPTAPMNHNKERKHVYMRTSSFYCLVLLLRSSRCYIYVERAGFSCLALHVVQVAIS
jgi:hypothetical protein